MMITGTRWLLSDGNSAPTQNFNIPPAVLLIAMPFDNSDAGTYICSPNDMQNDTSTDTITLSAESEYVRSLVRMYICTTLRGRHQSPKLCYITDILQFAVVYQNISQLQGYVYITVALYGLSTFHEITKCIINPLRHIRICLWVSFLGLKFNKFLGDYLRDASLIMYVLMESWLISCRRAYNEATHNGCHSTRGAFNFLPGRPKQSVT